VLSVPSHARRQLATVLAFALIIVLAPVAPVFAQEVAPETRSEVLERLPERRGGAPGSPQGRDTVIESDIVDAPIPFTTLGVKARRAVTAEVRTADVAGVWTDWTPIEPLEEDDGPD
jgi:hypothetical protein